MRRLLILLAATAVASACTGSGGGSPPGRPAPSPSSRTANVRGSLVAVGGQLGTRDDALRGTVTFTPLQSHAGPGLTPDAVVATVGGDGTFTAQLVPWTYLVAGRSPQFQGGHRPCQLAAPKPLRVRRGQNYRIAIYCQRR
jgi:hypothetical protein